jgi:hypothetical protein
MGFITQEDERTNFLMKKYFRANSTKTTQPSNKLESIQTNSSLIVFNEEIYSTTIPSVLPTFDKNYKFIDVNSVNYNNGTRTITISGTASSLYASEGLTTEIWQAFKDQKLYQVDASSTTTHIVKISKLNLSYISDTASISESPSYYHTVLKDCIPSTAYGQIYPITVEGNSSAAPTPTSTGYSHPLPNDVTGNWYVQSDAGILQFFDENAILPSTSINLFNTGLDPNGVELFNTAKGPGITFYKYIGTKGITSSSGSGTGQYTNFSNSNIEAFEFPPSAMTSDTTVLSDGTYVSSTSSVFSINYAYKAFDKNTTSTNWHGNASPATYSGTNNTYSGTVTTSNIDGSGTYSGEWLQLQLPTSIILSKYCIYNRYDNAVNTPLVYKLLGSSNNSSWTTLDYQENNYFGLNQPGGTFTNLNTYKTYYITNNTKAYNYYRLVTSQVNATVYVAIGELKLYGQKYNDTSINTVSLKNIYTKDINVGIGTDNPMGRLHIYNPNGIEDNLILTNGGGGNEFYRPQIRFGYGGTTNYSHFISSRHNNSAATNNTLDFFCNTGGYLNNSINANTKLVMTLEGTGNVGIGNTAPGNKLDVNGSISTLGPIWVNTVPGDATGGIGLYGTSAANNRDWGIYMAQSGASRSFKGTTAPSYNGITSWAIRNRAGTASTTGFIWENHADAALMSIAGDTGNLCLKGTCKIYKDATIQAPATNGTGERLILYDNGNGQTNLSIGIEAGAMWFNTNSAENFKFYNAGSLKTNISNGSVFIPNGGSYFITADGSLTTSSGANCLLRHHSVGNNVYIDFVGNTYWRRSGDGVTLMTLDSGGILYVWSIKGRAGYSSATVSPYAMNIYITGITTSDCYMYSNDTQIGRIQITSTCDYRVKQNIENIGNIALNMINRLRPVTYQHINIPNTSMIDDGITRYGFIAHELQEVIPCSATGVKDNCNADGSMNIQTVEWLPIVSVLTKAVQELSSKNDNLETSYSNLQTINNNLQSQINSMQSQINTILTTLSL